MNNEAKCENDPEIAPGLDLKDMGDASEETKQIAPIPRFSDSAYFFGYFPN